MSWSALMLVSTRVVAASRGFVKEFEPLFKWGASDFRNPLLHTEINSSTLMKEQSYFEVIKSEVQKIPPPFLQPNLTSDDHLGINWWFLATFLGADLGFPVVGGANIWFCQIFRKNCMKLRTFWAVRGWGAPGAPSLDPLLFLSKQAVLSITDRLKGLPGG